MAKILIGKYEGSIYEEGDGWTGAISLGFASSGKRKRLKRKGKTKTEVRDKLIEAVQDLEAGVKTSANYTVGDAVQDWLAKGLKGRDASTVTTNRILADKHVIPLIGKAKLKELRADDVDEWLDGLTEKLSSRTLQSVHAILKRSIRQAQARDKVTRNVAELVTTPKGRTGRPSKALTLPQAMAVMEEARSSTLHAYVVLSLMVGIRTEEARALRWNHVVAWQQDQDAWRAVNEVGFDHDRVRPLRLAFRANPRRHQDQEVSPDLGATRAGGRRPAAASRPPGRPAAQSRRGLGGRRPGLLHPDRDGPRRRQRAARVPADHREGGHRRALDSPRTPALLRLDPQ